MKLANTEETGDTSVDSQAPTASPTTPAVTSRTLVTLSVFNALEGSRQRDLPRLTLTVEMSMMRVSAISLISVFGTPRRRVEGAKIRSPVEHAMTRRNGMLLRSRRCVRTCDDEE